MPNRFKLHLKPQSIDMPNAPVMKLPEGRTVDDVYGDFLSFLKGCVRQSIESSRSNVWDLVGEGAQYILT